MQPDRARKFYFAVMALLVGCFIAATPAHAGVAKLQYAFGPLDQVDRPQSTLTIDSAGNLYGTSFGGDNPTPGIVFEMVKGPNGKFTEKIIYNFTGGSDGNGPNSGMYLDAAGNLYGTAGGGGDTGNGTVWELSPNPDGTWTETTLYSFMGYSSGANSGDGGFPYTGLVADAQGSLYGGTWLGGNFSDPYCGGAGCGIVFKLAHNPDGTWTESVLHAFLFIDGFGIATNLNFDAAGNLYGMSAGGGTGVCLTDFSHFPYNIGCGTVFQLALQPDGSWIFNRIFSFQGNQQGGTDGYGAVRNGGMVFDSKGNLYGTTINGGSQGCVNNWTTGCGTVFELSPQPNGKWTETQLHVFGDVPDGEGPQSLIMRNGILYGGAQGGGANLQGTFFELKPNAKEQWNYKTLFNFLWEYDYPTSPQGPFVVDSTGTFYNVGGLPGAWGSIFSIKP